MGSSPAAEAELTSPATRLYATPSVEVDVTCRLTLAAFLRTRLPDLPAEVLERLLGAGSADHRLACPAGWRELQVLLDQLTVLDPACGAGHFLVGMLDVLDDLGQYVDRHAGRREDRTVRRERIVRRNLFGVEIQEQMLIRARCRLAGGSPGGQTATCTNLVLGDSLVEDEDFAWERAFPLLRERNGFDLVVGNPPFVRHELISDPRTRRPREDYRHLAARTICRHLPAFLAAADERGTPRSLNRRADLSLLFLLLSLGLLHARGVLGMVVPTSLFEAEYGGDLYACLGHTGRQAVEVQSAVQRSFAQARVNTSILVALGPDGKHRGNNRMIRRVQLPTPLGRSALGAIWPVLTAGEQRSSAGWLSGSGARHQVSFVTLGSLGTLRYAVKTGLNRFFYPDSSVIARFGIEEEFLRPLLKSPREVRSIQLEPADLRARAFYCSFPPHEGAGAGAYIGWGSRQTTAAGLPWPLVPSLRRRVPWHSLWIPPPADVICARLIDRRYFFVMPEAPLVEDQTFYGLILHERYRTQLDTIGALLNSSFTYLALETHGRTGLGDGARQYALRDLLTLPVIDPHLITPSLLPDLEAAYRALAARTVLPIDREIEQPDRRRLDAIIGDAAGFSPAEIEETRRALVRRATERLARAESCRASAGRRSASSA